MFVDKETYEKSAIGGPETKAFQIGPYDAILKSAQDLRAHATQAKEDHAKSLLAEAKNLEKQAQQFKPIQPPDENEWCILKRKAETLRQTNSTHSLRKLEQKMQKFCRHASAKINCGKCPTCGKHLSFVFSA